LPGQATVATTKPFDGVGGEGANVTESGFSSGSIESSAVP